MIYGSAQADTPVLHLYTIFSFIVTENFVLFRQFIEVFLYCVIKADKANGFHKIF